jgi:hypothetical protein
MDIRKLFSKKKVSLLTHYKKLKKDHE